MSSSNKKTSLSKEFRNLKKRITELKKHFLGFLESKKHTDTRTFSHLQLDRIRAFLALVHAEIEYYIEQRAINFAVTSFQNWKKHGIVSITLLTIIAYSNIKFQKSILDLNPEDRLNKALCNYIGGIIKSNNGIKRENLNNILLPIGINMLEFEKTQNTWLNTIEYFAGTRGGIVHQSGIYINPKSEIGNIEMILDGLEKLDRKISQLN